MRNAFADEITRLGAVDKRVTLLSGDIGNKLFDEFKANNSDRFFNCGVAEANMMGMAAGLALNGLRPVVYTITPFTTTRCYEQIRVDVCYHRAPVVIVGTGAGLSYVDLGPTHHSCEDIAILRVLPEMTVLCPCDANELRAALRAALKHDGPVYMRIGKKGEPVIHKSPPDFEIGRAITVREGSEICLISTGNVMRLALDVADQLGIIGIATRVESFHTVKPLDTQRLAQLFKQYRVVAAVEEHSRIGGLASAIAEWLSAQERQRAEFLGFSLADRFLHEVGSQDYARRRLGLSPEAIIAGIKRALATAA